jgi:hypothetical protein
LCLNLAEWHYLAGAFLDVIRYLMWWLVGGLIAWGSCWYVGANVYENWVRETPAPRVLLAAELRLRRDLRRGCRALEEYLARQEAHGSRTEGRPQSRSAQPQRRVGNSHPLS